MTNLITIARNKSLDIRSEKNVSLSEVADIIDRLTAALMISEETIKKLSCMLEISEEDTKKILDIIGDQDEKLIEAYAVAKAFKKI